MRLNKALFLDLDGTLICVKSGSEFPKDLNDWMFIPKVVSKVAQYHNDGYIICIVTNQGGIELGHVTSVDMENKLRIISEELESEIGIGVNTIYCPYMESYHRKPNPGMAYTLALELSIDLRESIMVGDAESDKLFAYN